MINSFPGSATDVLVDTGGRILRIQVKATPHTRESVGSRGHAYQRYDFRIAPQGSERKYGNKGLDLFALVALDLKLALYIPADKFFASGNSTSKVFTKPSFISQATDSLDRYLATL